MIGGAKKGDDALQVWSFPTPTTTSTSFAFPSTLDDRYPHFPTTAAKVNLLTFDSNFPSFSFSYAMSPIQESLLSTLDKAGLSDEDALNALEEFAWTSIVQGKRVRDYCEDLTEVLGQVSPILPRTYFNNTLDRVNVSGRLLAQLGYRSYSVPVP